MVIMKTKTVHHFFFLFVADCCCKMFCNIPCRIILFIINVVSSIVALTLVTIGALMVWGENVMETVLSKILLPLINAFAKGDTKAIAELVTRLLNTTAPLGYVVFSLGCLILIISVVGYIGACCNSRIAFYIYESILSVLAIAILGGIIFYYARKDLVYGKVEKLFVTSIHEYKNMATDDVNSLIVGFVSPSLNCCGMYNSSEFTNMLPYDSYGQKQFDYLKYPIVCCKMDKHFMLLDLGCPAEFNDENSNIYNPCKDTFHSTFLKYADYVAIGLIAVFMLLLLLIAFTGCTIRVDVV
ncbi:uncharacterized protein DEA37_0006029 [Paragonimus westermani]|uniref:Tetraspanin-CD63 receptor n=1 Tax=Paragonimus westermani TaxID=34504 RepID=A0A5J4NX18_9TREM|nr:uncharacterized protein DEA37_0006029 [Paragonimus westermani]